MRALLILALLAGSAHADISGVYGASFSADFGTTYLPPTAGAGMATTLSYREVGGKLGNWIIFLDSMPQPPGGTGTVRYETECGATTCTTYRITTYTPPSDAEVAAWKANMSEFSATKGAAILRGEMGQTVTIDVTARAFGGNASGFKFQLMRPIMGSRYFQIGQYALGWLTYHGVKSQKVIAENGVLRSMEVTGDHTWGYVGMPIRVAAPITRQVGAHLQFDNNIYGWFMGDASPIRAGVDYVIPHVMISVEGVISGFRPDGYSLAGSVTLAL